MGTRRVRGFTLMELMIVVVILAVLAIVAVFAYTKYIRSARVQEAVSILGDIKVKQAQFRAAYGRFISTDTSASEWEDSSGYHPTSILAGGSDQPWLPTGNACATAAPDTALGRFCILGVRPTTPVYFQYKTIGWDPNTPSMSGQPPVGTIPTQAWMDAGSPGWWYAVARTHWTRDTRPQAWVVVLSSVILSEPITKQAYEVDFAQ